MAKFSGPRMNGGKYYSKRRAGRKPKATKMTEAKVEAIAKKAINEEAESKYFNSAALGTVSPINSYPNRTSMSVLGYCTGTAFSVQNTGTWKYGWSTSTAEQNMESLNMNRVFVSTQTDPILKAYRIQGTECSPSFAQTEWCIERDYIDTTSAGELDTAPLYCRMIRVKPIIKKGSYQPIDPKNDLFLDQYNRPTGVNSAGFQQYELMMNKVDNGKYRVIEDKRFVLNPPGTGSTLEISNGDTVVSNLGLTSFKTLKCRHSIGNKFFYETPDSSTATQQFPTDGYTPEFVLFHFTYMGVNANITTGLDAKRLNITCKPVSTFKDF